MSAACLCTTGSVRVATIEGDIRNLARKMARAVKPSDKQVAALREHKAELKGLRARISQHLAEHKDAA